ncbi:hypothetical protein MHBO_001955, partial [Bonamia ostreae]
MCNGSIHCGSQYEIEKRFFERLDLSLKKDYEKDYSLNNIFEYNNFDTQKLVFPFTENDICKCFYKLLFF